MTFAQIKADCFRRLGYATSPASDVVTRIAAFVNESHEQVLAEPGLASLLYGTATFASTVSRARYGLSNVAQIRSMTDTDHDRQLQPRDLSWYRAMNPDPDNHTGTPEAYIPLGIVAVQRVPAITGTGLWIVSSSASDTVPTVAIEAIRVGGYPHTPSNATVTGTTRVQIGGGSGLTDYIDVTQFALSAACVGDISLYDAATSGNLLGVIPRGQTTARYWGFLLSPTPSQAQTYTLDIEHELFTLSADTDEPLIPPRFHRLLAMGARVKEYERTESKRLGVAAAEYVKGLRDLIYAVTCPPDYTMVPGAGLTTRDFRPVYVGVSSVEDVSGEVPSGSVNSSNKVYTTAYAYRTTFLNVYLNGLRQTVTTNYTETSSTTFTMVVAPTTGDVITVDYIKAAN